MKIIKWQFSMCLLLMVFICSGCALGKVMVAKPGKYYCYDKKLQTVSLVHSSFCPGNSELINAPMDGWLAKCTYKFDHSKNLANEPFGITYYYKSDFLRSSIGGMRDYCIKNYGGKNAGTITEWYEVPDLADHL